eukprot:jgi/Undpi1/11361/HiC_scaffold_30.g13658.m1
MSVFDTLGVLGNIGWWSLDQIMETAGYGLCPIADDPVKAVTETLRERIRAQPLAIESLAMAVSAWHFSQGSGRHEPLVVALTGSTGTGKTETAWALADSLLTKRCRLAGGTKDIPRGLLVLNGGDYVMPAKVDEYHQQIRRKLGQRLKYCSGNVVVLFDELQKAAPGTLDSLMEAMSEHPRVTYEEGRKSVSVDTSRVIFVLVSDVGAERLDAVVRSFRSRSDVVAGVLQSAVKIALDEQWDRLRFGKVVDKVIPYLPMDPASIVLVIELKMQRLAETLPGGLYTTRDLRWHLVQPQYVRYSTFHVKPRTGGGEVYKHDLAVYGARDVDKESMRRITGILREHVLEAPCSGAQGQTGAGQITPGGGGGEGQGGDRRCWAEPFMVDIRYEKSTEQPEMAAHVENTLKTVNRDARVARAQ